MPSKKNLIHTIRRTYDIYLTISDIKKYIEQVEGKNIHAVYREMLSDAHIYSVLQQRKSAVLKQDYSIIYEGENPELKELVEFALDYMDGFYSALSSLLDAIAVGYSVVQVYWDYLEFQGRKVILPTKLEPNPWYWYKLEDEKIFFVDDNGNKKEVITGKVIVHKNIADPTYPNGVALLDKVWLPYFVKKNIPRKWLLYLESFVIPTVYAIYENLPEREQKKLLDDLINLQELRAAVFPSSVKEVSTIEGKKTSSEELMEFIRWAEDTISKVFLGGTLTSQLGDVGSYSASKVHYEVREDIAQADAQLLADTLNNTLLTWIVEFNFSPDEIDTYPYISFDFDKEWTIEEIQKLIEIAAQSGLEIDKKWLYRSLRIPIPDDEDEIITPITLSEKFRL